MTPELAAWALALPLSLRQALARVPGPGWWVYGDDEGHTSHAIWDTPRGWTPDGDDYRYAWLPCDPTAVVEAAADLAGTRSGRGVQYNARSGCWQAWCGAVGPLDAPTAIQAAVLVLGAVMGAKP